MTATQGIGRVARRTVHHASLAWRDDAECRDKPLGLFFGPDGERQADRDVREEKAKRVCRPCGVRTACLAYAMATGQPAGVWGGETTEERRGERRRQTRKAAPPPVPASQGFTKREADLYTASVHLMDRKGRLLADAAAELRVDARELRSIRRRGRQLSRPASSTA
ncbi:WhiB family transcriptional regulator [Streptosporangium sp. NPDC023963]|uniref:WhiB family transcriptional regulator n=1 Tax=Streptosporangium sp. NPDC023963 TaxID=3155608 RepID=UPI003423DF97